MSVVVPSSNALYDVHFPEPFNSGVFNEHVPSRVPLDIGQVLDRQLMRWTRLSHTNKAHGITLQLSNRQQTHIPILDTRTSHPPESPTVDGDPVQTAPTPKVPARLDS